MSRFLIATVPRGEPEVLGIPLMAMQLDLRKLREMHPLLPQTTSAEYIHRAALALQRSHHEPGAWLSVATRQEGAIDEQRIALQWDPEAQFESHQLDRHRLTEDAAEAVALALVNLLQQWVVIRRLQRGESADWLLRDSRDNLVALEVSGVNGPQDASRVKEKLAQVRIAAVGLRSACVVAFGPPTAILAMVSGPDA